MNLDLIYVYDSENKSIPEYTYDSIKSLCNKENINLHLIVNYPEIVFDELENKKLYNLFNRVVISKIKTYKKFNVVYHPQFRDNFFGKCINRFFILDNYIKKNNLTKCFHCECDIFFQVSLNEIYNQIEDKNKIYSCRDAPARIIASIMYIPDAEKIFNMTEYFITMLGNGEELNDMELLNNFDRVFKEINSFKTSPIDNSTPYIFDPACFGQNLLGIDPRNTSEKSTVGFINETSTYKPVYTNFKNINGEWFYMEYKLAILHIHCKDFSNL